MKMKKSVLTTIIFGIVLAIVLIILYSLKILDSEKFYFFIGLAVIISGFPFFIGLLIESKKEKNIEAMFLEFSRDLVEGVRAGTPINKSIINLKKKDYGYLNEHIEKIVNQVSLGIPVKDALEIFSRDVKNSMISRSVNLIREAERSGGNIESILESVSFSFGQIEKLKKERQAVVHTLVVQGYIIFVIFIAIMIILEFKIFPLVGGINTIGTDTVDASLLSGANTNFSPKTIDTNSLSYAFLYLLLVQGFFAGLVIGKISEDKIKAGLKHSFILIALAWLLSTGAKIIFQ